jgi:hypothetical protein
MQIPADHAALLDVEPIRQAGGLDPFCVEVLAEARTLGVQRARSAARSGIFVDPLEATTQALADVLQRRLRPVVEAEVTAAIQAANPRGIDAVHEAIEEAKQQALRRVRVIATRLFEP